MAEKLNTDQINYVFQVRPDVKANPYYGARPNEWWTKYGKNDYGDFAGMQRKFSTATPATQTTTPTQAQPYGTSYLPTPALNSYSTAPAPLTQQNYTFDPNQYLPQIQQQASAIYQPQQAQLEALRNLSTAQYEQNKIVTEEDFQKRMKQEVESINQRGAFFSGGAVQNEQNLRTEQSRALNTLNLQQQAAQADLLAKQGVLTAEQADYVKNQLYNTESGAYGRWKDSEQMKQQNYQTALNQFNAERGYGLDVAQFNQGLQQQATQNAQWEKSYEFQVLSKKLDTELDKQKMKLQYGLDAAKLKLAQDTFAEEISQFGQTMGYNTWKSLLDSSGDKSETQWAKSLSLASAISGKLVPGTDGKVDPQRWNAAREYWSKEGGDTLGDFESMYGYLINPNRIDEYNLNPSKRDI